MLLAAQCDGSGLPPVCWLPLLWEEDRDGLLDRFGGPAFVQCIVKLFADCWFPSV